MTFPSANRFASHRPPVAPQTPHQPDPEPTDVVEDADPVDERDLAEPEIQEQVVDEPVADQPGDDTEPEPAVVEPDPVVVADTEPPAPESAPTAEQPKPATKARTGRTPRKSTPKTAPGNDVLLIVVKDGIVTSTAEHAVIIDLDQAAAETVDAHQVVDMISELGTTTATDIRSATLATLTDLVAAKAMGARTN